VGRWRLELAEIGWPVERLAQAVDDAATQLGPPPKLSLKAVRQILGEVLSPEGVLARQKIFARRQVIVELAPYLFGQDPRALDVLADRALQDPEAIPLVRVAGAREQPFALASVLAVEQAIAAGLDRQLERRDAPTAVPLVVEAAIATAERTMGGALTAEQRQAATGICASGCGAELVVGVAGAGKTFMLRVVADAFEASGCRVIGTATSGQAARTLGQEAQLGEGRTLASLLWRLDHAQLALDERTVLILDEAGMTEDADLVALTARVEAAGAKLVVVGDHHQLGAVGPGGGLAALVRRHPEAVHSLEENRRQHDPDERHALAELRDGNTAEAVAWYASSGRIHTLSDRSLALQHAVDAWAADLAAGHQTGLYAWRRANVAALNQKAREWMDCTGRLTGPEVTCPGGNRYQAGDRVVSLAPGPQGSLVTSQRAVIKNVDLSQQTLTLATNDGQHVRLAIDQAGADRLDYAYATTVHRAQGVTVDRAHLYSDGGGRELAYVAMSRARQSTQVWAVADDLPQAADDLRRDWSTRRTPTWAIDTALPEVATLNRNRFQALPEDQQTRLAALFLAEQALGGAATTGVRLPNRAATLGQAQQALDTARQARADLETGSGVWAGTEAGRAVIDLTQARRARGRASQIAENGARWRDRHAARKEANIWARREADAEQRWIAHVGPQIVVLDQEISRHQSTLERTATSLDRREATIISVVDHALEQQRYGRLLASRLKTYRDNIDGVPTGEEIRRTATLVQQGRGLVSTPDPEPAVRSQTAPAL
jgi:hypothetical protein